LGNPKLAIASFLFNSHQFANFFNTTKPTFATAKIVKTVEMHMVKLLYSYAISQSVSIYEISK
jgi:hypothetical protein